MAKTGSIQITPELLALLPEIDEFKGAWRALGTLAPERLNALRHVATIESIGSSTRIAGGRLTDRDVERLLARLEIASFASRDEQEVAGYADVMETVFQAFADIRVTENHLKQLHRDLLRYSNKDERHPGEYKKLPNYVPFSSLESVVENSKEGYYLALRQTQSTLREEAPNWQPWLTFFLRALQQQKRRLAVKIEHEKIALADLSTLAVHILDYARDHGRITTRDMVREAGASPNTLKATLGRLVAKNLLARHGGGRSTWYSLP